MKRQMERAAWSLGGAIAVLGIIGTYGVAVGQAPGGGGRFGGGMAQGKVASVDPQNNAVLITTQANAQQWVQIPQGVQILKQETIAVKDLKEKDVITVNGTPTGIIAESAEVRADQPLAQAGDQNAPRGAPRLGAQAQVTGTVTKLPKLDANPPEPLVLQVDNNATVNVTVNDKTKLSRRAPVQVKDLAQGESFFAFGQPGANNVIQARMAIIGDPQTFFGGFGRGGFGRGGRGGRGGGFPQGGQ